MNQTLAEILKPIHDEVEATGIGAEELDQLVDQALAAARAEQSSRAEGVSRLLDVASAK